MLRVLSAASLVALLAGCASAPKPQIGGAHVKSAPAKSGTVSKSAPTEATTPNQIVKKRWSDRFKVHPKWFH